jgi:uncharacterized protein (DUF1778 family)
MRRADVSAQEEVGSMAKDTSPLCFRLSPDDRRLIETVAAYTEQSVSDFVRSVVINAAAKILRDQGVDKIVQTIEERNERMSEEKRRAFEAAAEQHSGSRRS